MDKQEVLTISKRYELHLDENSLEFVNIGLDFQVVFVTDDNEQKWVLRIPRRKDAFLKAQSEYKILKLVSQWTTSFQVPNWKIFSEELIAYQPVSGKPVMTTDNLTQENNWLFAADKVPASYTDSLGQVLADLHAIPAEQAKEAGLTVEAATDLQAIMENRMVTVKDKYEINDKLWARWQSWLQDDNMWPQQIGFIHGDLYVGHTLVDDNFAMTGIIDWTEAKFSDVSIDFTAFYLIFGEEELANLITAYQKYGGYTWPKMKEHIIEHLSTQAITIAEFAESSGSADYEEIAREMLKKDIE